MSLVQEVQTLKKENKYNTKEIEKEIERLQKQLEKAKQEKEYKKDEFKAIENELKDTFKQNFNEVIVTDLKEYEKNLNLKYNKLKTLDEKDKYIQMFTTSDLEGHFIDDNYYKILEKVYKNYLNDLKAKQNIELKAQEEQQEKELQKYIEEIKKQDAEKKRQEELGEKMVGIGTVLVMLTIAILIIIKGFIGFLISIPVAFLECIIIAIIWNVIAPQSVNYDPQPSKKDMKKHSGIFLLNLILSPWSK